MIRGSYEAANTHSDWNHQGPLDRPEPSSLLPCRPASVVEAKPWHYRVVCCSTRLCKTIISRQENHHLTPVKSRTALISVCVPLFCLFVRAFCLFDEFGPVQKCAALCGLSICWSFLSLWPDTWHVAHESLLGFHSSAAKYSVQSEYFISMSVTS